MDRDRVQAWVDAYVRWWRASDPTGVPELFSPDVRYLRPPYEDPVVGHADLSEFWVADEDAKFEVTSEVVAADGVDAVVRLQVDYREPDEQQHRDLWVLRSAADGRVEHFEEWAYFPGQPYTVRAAQTTTE